MSDKPKDDKAEDKAVDKAVDPELEDTDESAESDPDAESKEEEKKPGLKDKLAAHKVMVFSVLFLVIIAGTVAGLYFTGKFTAKKPHEISLALPDAAVFHEIPKVTVDLKPSPKHPRPFIRLVMQVELQGESAKTAFIERETRILDAMQTHLRTLTVPELQDTDGTQRLRTDLLMVINNVIRPERAITVYYKEIMIR